MTETSAGKGRTNRVALVESFFHGTGDTYDQNVHLATWGRDRKWKEELLSFIDSPDRIMDLACGTGILSLEMARRFDNAHVTGVELRGEYLDICRERAAEHGWTGRTHWIESNAEDVKLDQTFDAITSCYIPKYVNLDVLVPNMVSMLAPGGLFIMQDFSYPEEKWVQDIFDDHFDRMKLRINGEGWDTMWEQLPDVVRLSTWVEDTARNMREQGLVDVTIVRQSRGLSTVVYGRKPQ